MAPLSAELQAQLLEDFDVQDDHRVFSSSAFSAFTSVVDVFGSFKKKLMKSFV
jgi:hypothetical protein